MGYWAKDGSFVHDEHDANINIREGVPRGSGIIEKSETEKHWENVKQKQVEREMQESREIKDRISSNERQEKEYDAAAIIKHEELEKYRNQSWFKKMFAKLKGNNPYLRQDELYDQAIEQVRAMSDIELDNLIRNGRTK